MATPAYEGGIGGKFRKRPLRRPPATPYDRPAAASRGGVRSLKDAAEGSGTSLRAKLVDTASQFIANGASRFFASFFRKRLTAPPEENRHSRQEVPEVASTNPPSKLPVLGGNGRDEPTSSFDGNNSDNDGISDLEELLKNKTFTRDEFDHLAELLRSRTIEPCTPEPTVSTEKRENENNPAQENRVGVSRLHDNLSTVTTSLTVTKDEVASPADLAKAYMGSKSTKVSPSTLSLRSQVFHEDTTMRSIVPRGLKPAVPRSVVRFSGVPELPENGYHTPKPRGRSAISQMSRSPYFKPHPSTNVKGWEPTGDHDTAPSSSRLTPKSLLHSGGRQVLKRGSSALDSDFDSFGPKRRIRQKSYLTSPSGESHSRGFPFHKPSPDEYKDRNTSLHEAENKESKLCSTSVTPIPPKSSETAMKIFQQLNIIMSSPKQKSSEGKAIAMDKSPSNLTDNKVAGWSSKNTEHIGSSKFFNVQEGGSLDRNSDSRSLGFINSPSKKPLVIDDENRNTRDAPGSLSSNSDEIKANILKHSNGVSESAIPEKSLMSSPNIPGSSSSSPKEAVLKGSGRLVLSGKETGFSFSVASGQSPHSQPLPTPTMPSPSLDVSTLQKEQIVAPVFTFGSKASPPSTKTSIDKTTCQKVGARDADTAAAVEGSTSNKNGEMPKAENLTKSFGNAVFSGTFPTNSVFGAPTTITTTTQSNGSLFPGSLISPLAAAPPVARSDSLASATFFTSSATTTTTTASSPSISSSAPIFSSANSFNFGSSTSTVSPASNSHPVNFSSSSSDFGSSPFGFSTFGTGTSTSYEFPSSSGPASTVSGASSSLVPAVSTSVFTPSSQPFKSSPFGFTFGASASSPSTGSLFGQSSSSATPFLFTSAVSTTPSGTSPALPVCFGGSPGDQMNVEDSNANDTNRAAASTASAFGQPTNSPTTPSFHFGLGTITSGGPPSFQFGGNQNPSTLNSPFQDGNLNFTPGGSFSVGSGGGGGDKSGRRIIKIKRDRKLNK